MHPLYNKLFFSKLALHFSPIYIASIILIKSPIINGATPIINASFNDKCKLCESQIVPKIYNTVFPKIIPKAFIYIFSNLSINIPDTIAKNMYPIIYPPVGPKTFCTPPVNPENTGKPQKPINIYNIILTNPGNKPNIYTDKIIANVDSDMGTILSGVTIEIGAITHIIDVITATSETLVNLFFRIWSIF